ncbi:MAG TPA: adenosylcobinamide-GDP ribazoletransferase [Chloroflexota bacterium]
MSGLLSALAFLTRLPVPARNTSLEQTVVWLPLVGLLLGAILAIVDLGLRALSVSSFVNSTVLVVLLLLLTGALHADGLMDTCDAVFSHATPERRLEIMRDPRSGAFGVVGIVSILLLKVASLDALPVGARVGSLVLAPTLGRWAIVLLATVFPYGRTVGMGAPLKAAATPHALALASLVPIVACAVMWPWGPLVGVLAVVTAFLLGRWLVSLLPGLTGDCYGAGCEIVETVVLLAAGPLARVLA